MFGEVLKSSKVDYNVYTSRKPLSKELAFYAANDAIACYKIHNELQRIQMSDDMR